MSLVSPVGPVGGAQALPLVSLSVGAVGRTRTKRPTPGSPATRRYVCDWGPEGPRAARALAEPEPVQEAALELSISPEDAELVRSGELPPSVAFMQGRLKTAGDNALLLEVLAWTATGAFAQALRANQPH